MKVSLYQKLAISLVLGFVLIAGTFVVIMQRLEAISRDQAEQELHQELAAHLVHDNPLLANGEHDQKALENLFHSMMILGPNFEFYVLDLDGNILTYSAKPGEVIRDKVELEPIQMWLDGRMSMPVYAADPRSDQAKIFSAAPIVKDGKTRGYLYVIVGGQIYDSIFSGIKNNEQIQLVGIMAIASVLFLITIILFSFQFFVSPLKRLTCQVKTLKSDGFNKKITPIYNENSGLEVAELSSAFNELISQVNNQFELLSKVDTERRELLAHLSHDLRTPLASLQGFLETIQLKYPNSSESEIQSYVKRCLKSARSLKGFVDQIFELAHLESGHVTVNFETFPVADLLYDLVDKFSIAAQQKGIELAVELDSENVQVITDIAKLERVLSNLIENAIRHTPKNGQIYLSAVQDNSSQQAVIAVRDNGTGIKQDELPYLFDARYRGKHAIDDGSRHIGLGLTITKKLINILGSEIKADNNPDGGAKFKFNLPLPV
ncbi:sensor histidine kinase [Aliikangiella coralliicola]|uniref:histidine kinase n=1 Tax=Aliikangiella coralliicola TaxID=2592383 RepID=A0A545UAF7_9GAMM|nr:HAMP domain-containing sensor histidine kinase [Aliikangiella coralliicola]TQV86454.1 HAMP domain-containing histidine kinase [Aliikangiella coralliicola]